MPAFSTVSKGLSEAQDETFNRAIILSGLDRSAAINAALKLFAESQGLKWPDTQQHGGRRIKRCDLCSAPIEGERCTNEQCAKYY